MRKSPLRGEWGSQAPAPLEQGGGGDRGGQRGNRHWGHQRSLAFNTWETSNALVKLPGTVLLCDFPYLYTFEHGTEQDFISVLYY